MLETNHIDKIRCSRFPQQKNAHWYCHSDCMILYPTTNVSSTTLAYLTADLPKLLQVRMSPRQEKKDASCLQRRDVPNSATANGWTHWNPQDLRGLRLRAYKSAPCPVYSIGVSQPRHFLCQVCPVNQTMFADCRHNEGGHSKCLAPNDIVNRIRQ